MDDQGSFDWDAGLRQMADGFLTAFNRRDAEGLLEFVDADIEFRPSVLVKTHALYRGHEGMRQCIDDLRQDDPGHSTRLGEIRAIAVDRYAVLLEVVLDDVVLSPATAIVRLRDGKLVHATVYLSELATLVSLGVVPEAVASEPTDSYPRLGH